MAASNSSTGLTRQEKLTAKEMEKSHVNSKCNTQAQESLVNRIDSGAAAVSYHASHGAGGQSRVGWYRFHSLSAGFDKFVIESRNRLLPLDPGCLKHITRWRSMVH